MLHPRLLVSIVRPPFLFSRGVLTRLYSKGRHGRQWYDEENELERNDVERSSKDRDDKHVDFLYGLNVIIPALEQRKRKLLRFFHQDIDYVSQRRDRAVYERILELAREAQVHRVKATKAELDELVDKKPHQGVVLKASRLTPTKIRCLDKAIGKKHDDVARLVPDFDTR